MRTLAIEVSDKQLDRDLLVASYIRTDRLPFKQNLQKLESSFSTLHKWLLLNPVGRSQKEFPLLEDHFTS